MQEKFEIAVIFGFAFEETSAREITFFVIKLTVGLTGRRNINK